MKKRILALVLAAVMTAALCACGGGQSTKAPAETADTAETPSGSTGEKTYGGEITIGIAADLDSSLDPHVSSSSAGTREVLFNIYEGLMKPDTDGNLIPAVAESYTVNETADEYTFTLREGVKFHNGDTVTVGDVVYSLSRAAGLETGEPLVSSLSGVAAVEAADDRTVVITLSAPDAEFIAYTSAAIVPDGSDPAQNVIGTGPYTYVSRAVQDNIVLEKFEDYWGEGGNLDRVIFKVIEDGQTMVMSLRSGAIDMAAHLEQSQAAELSDLTVLEGGSNLVQALYLNNAAAPLDDIRVRQALSYAIDKYAVIELAADGHGVPLGTSMYPSFSKYYADELTDYYAPDLEKAKELLAEAGYPDGFSFTIDVVASYTPHVAATEVIVELLRQIGVTAKINTVEWETWYSETYQGRNFEATVCGVDGHTLTGSAMLSRFQSDNAKNFINFASGEYDETYAQAVATTDEQEQVRLFKRCQTILTEQAASVYIQDNTNFVVTQNDIGGFRYYPLYVMDLSTLYRLG